MKNINNIKKYTDAEFKQLDNLIYYEAHWDFDNILSSYNYELRTYIYSYDDNDSNILYTPDIKDLKKIYYILKSKCCKPKFYLYLKLNNKISQP